MEVGGYSVNFITNKRAEKLYNQVKDLPIIDYHCHLSPKEIYEDKPFKNIGELWLSGDHYKWRLMRFYGINENLITGDADIKSKFCSFIDAVSTAFGNPIRDWVRMELSSFFGIDLPLTKENASLIWERANRAIQENQLSPRKLIGHSKVEYIGTTDDVLDDLHYHIKLREESYPVKVCPSFRTDRLFNILNDRAYFDKLCSLSGIDVTDINGFESAVENRLSFFHANGCRFSDVGIQGFPSEIGSKEEVNLTLAKFMRGETITPKEQNGFGGYLFVLLGKLYHKYDIVQQWHLGAKRNSNTLMKEKIGLDSGFDSVGETIDVNHYGNVLNALCMNGTLPKTILYTLNPAMYYPMITLCGSFREVTAGVAWWFNDHVRGITDFLECFSELSHLDALVGMLTDSRSFLSYVRHDYYRQIVAEFLSRFMDSTADTLVAEMAVKLCYENARKLISMK